MSRCIITGIPTNNSWKGKVLCKAIVEVAKKRREVIKRRSLRDEIIYLQKEFKERRDHWYEGEDITTINLKQHIRNTNKWLNEEMEKLK